ncbi:protein HID1-like [Sinocyclocheilus rhinocerous]|uniref:protein HID1-like n=1 Tax=Sinocyclocheilus rhinocerous TaxID=307959 RepID=UPI0007B917F2|nr:PREDICTED: protein HID1-like [Sinocyclocheilus rhinocerous]
MYQSPSDTHTLNPWVSFFCSRENRHALPLFTSLLNVVCAYDPVGYGIPYNHLMFSDQRGMLAELALQTLIVSLEQELVDNSNTNTTLSTNTDTCSADYNKNSTAEGCQTTRGENLFVNYLSRIHREEDFHFILRGIGRLLNNPLLQTYLPHSCKKIQFHQELLVLFWKLCSVLHTTECDFTRMCHRVLICQVCADRKWAWPSQGSSHSNRSSVPAVPRVETPEAHVKSRHTRTMHAK